MPNSLISIMNENDHRKVDFSPLFIGLLGIIAGAIFVATYHCIAVSCCPLRRTLNTNNTRPSPRTNEEQTPSSTSNSTVQLITVYRYTKGCKEGTCAVCLSEFKEGEEIRILTECGHSFHASCIDMWLYSHSNCPLCRAEATPSPLQHVVVSVPDSCGVPAPELHGVVDFGG